MKKMTIPVMEAEINYGQDFSNLSPEAAYEAAVEFRSLGFKFRTPTCNDKLFDYAKSLGLEIEGHNFYMLTHAGVDALLFAKELDKSMAPFIPFLCFAYETTLIGVHYTAHTLALFKKYKLPDIKLVPHKVEVLVDNCFIDTEPTPLTVLEGTAA